MPKPKFDHPPFHYPPSVSDRMILPLMHDSSGDITMCFDGPVTVSAANVPDFAKHRIGFVIGAHVVDLEMKLDKQRIAIGVAIATGPVRDLGWRVTRNIMALVVSDAELNTLKKAAGL